jgi:uncharacterized membrane protein YphA (DoxX/SURF4 family)
MERLIFFGRVLIATPFLADVVKKIIYTDQGQTFLQIGGIPPPFLYGLIIVEGVGALTLLVGYRTELAAAILLVLSLVLAFILHNPAAFLRDPIHFFQKAVSPRLTACYSPRGFGRACHGVIFGGICRNRFLEQAGDYATSEFQPLAATGLSRSLRFPQRLFTFELLR